MSIIYESRFSDSPFVESITRGYTASDGSAVRPAENCWHMVFVRTKGQMLSLVVGPWTTSGAAAWKEGAEILWVKFSLGAFMPHLATRDFLNTETILPESARQTFWLKGTEWQFPDFENVETFINRLVREEILVRDPVVNAALQEQPQEMSPRTLRYHFLRATGLTQSHIRQFERAQRAAALLEQGLPIVDAVYELGYFDQPHLTRSLKQFIGYTPAQILQMKKLA